MGQWRENIFNQGCHCSSDFSLLFFLFLKFMILEALISTIWGGGGTPYFTNLEFFLMLR